MGKKKIIWGRAVRCYGLWGWVDRHRCRAKADPFLCRLHLLLSQLRDDMREIVIMFGGSVYVFTTIVHEGEKTDARRAVVGLVIALRSCYPSPLPGVL